jgi:hypothetical protein
VLYRSVVQSAADANHWNKLVEFNPDVQDIINRLDVKSSTIIRNNNHKHKIRGRNDDVSNRTRSKVGHIDQNVGLRNRSKLQATYNSTKKAIFFPLYDVITFKAQGSFESIDLQSGLTECRVFHNAKLETNFRSKFHYLSHFIRWKRLKMIKEYFGNIIRFLSNVKRKEWTVVHIITF